MIKLDLRLERVFEYVCGEIVCDIGCDHGKLGAKLLITGKAKEVYGIDVSSASLEKSRELKDSLGLKSFHLLVGNGFAPVLDKAVDCGIICGIGSNETIGIISCHMAFAAGLKTMVLCPLKNTYIVRSFLFENGFVMADEDLVFENGRYYNIFVCRSGTVYDFDDVDVYVGRRLIEKGHPLLKSWLEKRIKEVGENIESYDRGVQTKREDKRENLQRMYNAYVKGMKLCE